jgi:hypothetical protein
VNEIKFEKDCGDDSMEEFSIDLCDDFLVKNYPKSFKYKNRFWCL